MGLISEIKDDPSKCFFRMNTETRFTLEYLLRFVMRLCEKEEDGKRRLVARLVAALTIKRVQIHGESIPRQVSLYKLTSNGLISIAISLNILQKSTWLVLSSRSRESIFNLIYSLMHLIETDYE